MKIFIYIICSVIFLSSCNGQQKEKNICSTEQGVIKIISELSEVKKNQSFVDSITQHKRGVSYIIDNEKINGINYYQIKTGYNGNFHWETYNIFYIDKNNCNKILVNDIVSGDIITLQEWRRQKLVKKADMKTKKELFSELFNEGSNIKFTPNDLYKQEVDIKEFKSKLVRFESQEPDSNDFNIDDLILLLNNETFTNNEKYINSEWLAYFLKKYKIEEDKIYALMTIALSQEDYNAIKILVNDGLYIISSKQLDYVTQRLKYVESLHGKIDIEEYYDPSYSRIKEIQKFLLERYKHNKIKDPDGYTNLRKDKTTSSEILQKIITGSQVEVLDNSGDWWLVQTKEGKKGYVYKTKIKVD